MLLSIVATQSSDSLFQLGNTYYENEQYEIATRTYEQLENDYSHEYLYNLYFPFLKKLIC